MNINFKEGREFFDVDHTITKTSTAISYLILMIKNKLIPVSVLVSVPYAYFNYKYGKMNEKRKRVLEYAAEKNIDLKKSSFYSDSIHNRPLLEEVLHHVAVIQIYDLKFWQKNKVGKYLILKINSVLFILHFKRNRICKS